MKDLGYYNWNLYYLLRNYPSNILCNMIYSWKVGNITTNFHN